LIEEVFHVLACLGAYNDINISINSLGKTLGFLLADFLPLKVVCFVASECNN